MIRLIATDLDNTLLNKESKVDPETIRLLERAAEKGVKVAVATGRSFASAKAIADRLGQPSPAICYNGAAVIDTQTGEPYFMDCLDPELVREILVFARENKLLRVGTKIQTNALPGPGEEEDVEEDLKNIAEKSDEEAQKDMKKIESLMGVLNELMDGTEKTNLRMTVDSSENELQVQFLGEEGLLKIIGMLPGLILMNAL